MFFNPLSPLDPGIAALFGALIGAGASMIVQIIAAFVTARHESRSFQRTFRKEQVANVADAYEHALNVIFNMRTDGNPDRSTRGKVFAQISLRGSAPVRVIIETFLNLSPEEKRDFEIEGLIEAMQRHITQLENDTE